VAVRVLDAELAEAVGRVVDRVVDACAAALHFLVDPVGVIDADICVNGLLDDLPVRDQAVSVASEREQDDGGVSTRNGEVGRVPVDLALEPEPIPVEGDRAVEIGDEEEWRDPGQLCDRRTITPSQR
jgi:hypothetical protein